MVNVGTEIRRGRLIDGRTGEPVTKPRRAKKAAGALDLHTIDAAAVATVTIPKKQQHKPSAHPKPDQVFDLTFGRNA
jgi:hypothetical protein